jgi:hypothetical protein
VPDDRDFLNEVEPDVTDIVRRRHTNGGEDWEDEVEL